jgi:hypothetical protein
MFCRMAAESSTTRDRSLANRWLAIVGMWSCVVVKKRRVYEDRFTRHLEPVDETACSGLCNTLLKTAPCFAQETTFAERANYPLDARGELLKD